MFTSKICAYSWRKIFSQSPTAVHVMPRARVSVCKRAGRLHTRAAIFVFVADPIAAPTNLIKQFTRGLMMHGMSGRERAPTRPKKLASCESETSENSARAKESRDTILKTKRIIVELLQYASFSAPILQSSILIMLIKQIMDVRRDYRITVALAHFKAHFPCNENGELEAPPIIGEETVNELRTRVFDKTESELDFDGERGQQLIRILLQMTMNDSSQLTSMALKVLFRHFNQYQELSDDLKQASCFFVFGNTQICCAYFVLMSPNSSSAMKTKTFLGSTARLKS